MIILLYTIILVGVALPSGGVQFPGAGTPNAKGMDVGDQQGKFGSMKNRRHTPTITEDEIGAIGS